MVKRIDEEVESNFYDKETVVCEIEKSENKKIRISIGEKKDTKYVNTREFYKNDDGEWLPGKSGMCVNDEVIEDLVEGLQMALEEVL